MAILREFFESVGLKARSPPATTEVARRGAGRAAPLLRARADDILGGGELGSLKSAEMGRRRVGLVRRAMRCSWLSEAYS
eukprot:SAG11_NODE_1138_length_5724_cov_188.276978_3_plen_80_part_00